MTPTSGHPVRRVTLWLEGLSGKPHAAVALFSCAFIEASILPFPSDIPLIALGVSRPRRSVLFSLLVVAGSSAGAVLGYYLGSAAYDAVGSRLITFSGLGPQFEALLKEYRVNAWLVLVLAGFTPVPFMVFTLAAGFNSTVSIMTLLSGVLCGRLIRFVPIGVALYVLGPGVKRVLDLYLRRVLVITGVAIVLVLIIVWSTR